MAFFKKIFCKHQWHFEGRSYVVCDKCSKVLYDPKFNRKLQSDFFDQVERNNPNAPDWIKIFMRRHY